MSQAKSGDTVKIPVEGDHPLAGKALNFDIELVDIARAA